MIYWTESCLIILNLKNQLSKSFSWEWMKQVVEKTIKMVNQNEYKRYQTPPILRISSKAFGSGRKNAAGGEVFEVMLRVTK